MPAPHAERGRARGAAFLFGALGVATLTVFFACSSEAPLQGDSYEPKGTLPTAPPTERSLDAATTCADAACDAGSDAATIPVPTTDGSTAPSNTCETARDIGTVSGDTLTPGLSAQGSCAEWLSFRATENDDGVFGEPMKLKVTLGSPPADDFNLYAFVNPDKDVVVCSGAFAASEQRGNGVSESVELTWGEGTLANGSDESRTVGLLVFHPNGPCTGGGTWRIAVDGHL